MLSVPCKQGKGRNDLTDESVRNLQSRQLLPLYKTCRFHSIFLVSSGQEENNVNILPCIVSTPLLFGEEFRCSKAVAFLNDEAMIFVLF